jgi:hypothetical protein
MKRFGRRTLIVLGLGLELSGCARYEPTEAPPTPVRKKGAK